MLFRKVKKCTIPASLPFHLFPASFLLYKFPDVDILRNRLLNLTAVHLEDLYLLPVQRNKKCKQKAAQKQTDPKCSFLPACVILPVQFPVRRAVSRMDRRQIPVQPPILRHISSVTVQRPRFFQKSLSALFRLVRLFHHIRPFSIASPVTDIYAHAVVNIHFAFIWHSVKMGTGDFQKSPVPILSSPFYHSIKKAAALFTGTAAFIPLVSILLRCRRFPWPPGISPGSWSGSALLSRN